MSESRMPEQGQEAPDFTLPDQDGKEVTLSDLRGQPVVLYFYPKADTPGCTTQACGIRDHRNDYEGTGARVSASLRTRSRPSGSSPRSTASTSPCSPTRTTRSPSSTASGARRRCTARPTWACSARPSSSIREGKVAKVFPKVSPKTHDEVVLEALGELDFELA